MYIAKYLILFPAFAFFWFAVLTFILALLSKERAISEILVIALATVGVIRVAAYYSEDLSRDVAKILPFAVLGLFLIDASFFEVSKAFDVLAGADKYRESILYYMLFIVALEFSLRLILGVVTLFVRWKNAPLKSASDYAESTDAKRPSVEWPDLEEDVAHSQPSSITEPEAETTSDEEERQERRSDEKTEAPIVPQTTSLP